MVQLTTKFTVTHEHLHKPQQICKKTCELFASAQTLHQCVE